MNTTDAKAPAALSRKECISLLAAHEVGRIVYTLRALPAVTPVHFVLRDGAVWVWTVSWSMVQAVRGAVVAFEADHLDVAAHTGWSVMVLGVAELVMDPKQVTLARSLGPAAWVPGRSEHLVRVPLKLVSGRRVGAPDEAGGVAHPESGGPSALARAVS
jgi:nitroimidazol reductase NimA-like FMN-containing flavoprotein (pyridoxamine 5'-phosphate oxidase superfamily)